MAAISGKNSQPEIIVRKLIHSMGFRFRLHVTGLAGTPDIVLPRLKAIVLVNGCFWHMHTCKRGKSTPTTNASFWRKKRLANRQRDLNQLKQLRDEWAVVVVWQCEIKNQMKLERKLQRFLDKHQRRRR